jgi:putative nucleotidyltransferase with HDIG domain
MEFPCNSPNQRRWFLASANRLGDGQGCVISQTNITPTKLAQEAIVRRALELDALNQIAKSLGEVENRRRLFARLTERFAKLFNADASVITLVNEENDLITAQAPGYNIPNQLIERIKFSLSVANHSWDLKLLGPLRADGFEQIPDFFIPFARELEVNTVLAVPFFKKDDLSGVIIVMRHEGVFCQEDVDLLQVLAHQTSILIEKANLIDITQEDLVRFALLHRVGKLCIEIKDTDELLAQVTNTIKDSLSLEHLGILLYHPYKKLYMPHTSYDLPEAFKNNQVEVGRGTVGEVIKTGRPIIIGNVDTATNYIQVDPLTKSELVVPLMIGDQVMGAINVESKVKQRFDNSDLQLFTTLANLLASAIARLRQIETERKQHLLAESFQKAVRATNQSLETNQIMDEILNQVRGVLPVDFANIMVFENGDIRVARAFGYDKLNPPVEIENITFKLDNNPVMRSIAREKNTLLVRDTTKYKDWTVFPVTSWVRSFIGSPIQVDGTVYGVLNLDSPEQGFFTKEHAEILEYFSDQVAVAMKNARLYQDLENSYEETLKGWVRNLAMRDDETEEHTQRVTILTVDLARRLGVSEDKLIHYRRGALLHDIGKMGIPDSILHKKGKLTHDEWEIMRKHPVYAYDLLKEIRFLHEALDIPRYHHERYNGSGYPEGLKGKAIPLAARIFAVVDIWDALSHDRPYRKAWSQSKVIGYLKETAGKELDPEIVSVFLQMLNDKRVTTGALHQKDIREFWTSLQHTNSYNESSNYP